MTTIIKGKIMRPDLTVWDGLEKTTTRKDSTGGTITGLKVGTEVDVLQAYGGGTNYTKSTIQKAIDAIGSTNSTTLVFNPGTWTIDANITIGSNFTCRVPAGCIFSVSSGVTLTFSGPVIHDAQTWTSGSGTVTENGVRYFSGNLDLTGAVLRGETPLVFEGATADAFETSLIITDPTADRTVTIPDANVDLTNVVTANGSYTFTGSNKFTHIIETEGAAVASAATTEIWATDGNTRHITGVATITGLGTATQAGQWQKIIFDDALTLTHGANLNLPGSANITTAANDFAWVYADTTTQHDVLYFKKDGTAVVATSISAGTPLTLNPVTVNTTTTQAHGLGVEPTFLKCVLECLTGEVGYSAGDRMNFSPPLHDACYWIVLMDATNLTLYWNTLAFNIAVPHKSTRTSTGLTAANWKLIITPYKVT